MKKELTRPGWCYLCKTYTGLGEHCEHPHEEYIRFEDGHEVGRLYKPGEKCVKCKNGME